GAFMVDRADVWQGTLALMVLKTLEALGPQHGYGIARRIEQTSGDLLVINYGTLYPALLKLEQEGYIESEWGVSDNKRKAKFYRLTDAGRKQVHEEAREWERTTVIVARFLSPREESWSRTACAGGSIVSPAPSMASGAIPNSPTSSPLIYRCTSTTT